MPTQQKIEQVVRIKAEIEKARVVYFTDLSRLSAVDIIGLRRQWKKQGLRLKVVKNRLAKRALAEAGITDDLAAILRGPTALVLGSPEEPYAGARLLRDAGQKFKELKFKGAYVEQALFTADQFDVLASMPTRPELQAMLVGVLLSPLQQLTAVLEGVIAGLVMSLDELAQKKAKEAPTATEAVTENKPDAPMAASGAEATGSPEQISAGGNEKQ